MSEIAIGKPVPDFQLPATGDQNLSLSDFRGSHLVLYFYPKDNTPGCTTEGKEFRDHHGEFQSLNTEILGVSRDGIRAHENFRSRYEFPFHLLSDRDESLCRAFDVIKEKKMFGKKAMGIERSTFLIDADGVLRKEWRKVRVKDHVAEVLDAVRSL